MNKSDLTEEEFGRILELEKIVKLNSDDISWSYNKTKYPKDKDIYDYQYEGISQLISRLDDHKVALLADEVGMGKTFQALSVMSYYFNKAINKDNFKVLVLSPNNIVMNQWRTEEYEKFYTHFLQEPKNIPIYNIEKKTRKNDNIIELHNFEYGFRSNNSTNPKVYAQIVFAKTSSFQFGYGTDDNKKINILTKSEYCERIEECQKDIKEFDLIVVDEAHQYRNYYGDKQCDSNRVTNARMIFNEFWKNNTTERDPKLLLLTATPLHSTNNDVKNVLSVLYKNYSNENCTISQLLNNKENSKSISKEIMNHIMVRRLKVMNGKTKYDYRQEKQLNVQLSNTKDVEVNVKNELFLALLQKKYIHSKNINNAKKNLSRSKNLLDILEGSDFGKITENKEKTDDDLKCIISKYEKLYENLPTNNKYKDVLDNISPKKAYEDKNLDDKALVFVRRTASAYNLAREYIEIFDTKAWEKIKQSNNKINKKTPYPKDREEFSRLIEDKQKNVSRVKLVEDSKKDFVIDIFNDVEYKEYLLDRTISNNSTIKGRVELLIKFYDTNNDSIELLECDLLDFVEKYKAKIGEMIAEDHVVNYWKKNEDIFKVKLKLSNVSEIHYEKIHKINIAQEYFNIEDEYTDEKFINFIRMDMNIVPKSYILDHFTKKKEKGKSNDAVKFHNRFTDITSKFYNFFKDNIPEIIYTQLEEPEKYKILVDNNLLIKSAVLNASIGLVELYCCYMEIKEKTYEEFLEKVKEKVKSDDLTFIRQIKYLINNFPTFQENGGYSFIKDTVNNSKNKPNDEENQKIFYRSQPAYPYVGNTKNDTVISRFNSPFFPVMLCGTSTLQVGVNLHRFCSKVYHFGAAHTMGDDEQRIGRVDRIKGKLHRKLEQDGSAKLDIYYPYLEKTFDEDNLKRMLCKKRSTEIEIDNCEMTSDSLEVNCISSDSELKEIDIKYLLRPKF